jgi:antitoxin VapB
MALNIKNAEVERLARSLAKRTGKSITDVVLEALRDRLAREQRKRGLQRLSEELAQIRERCSRLPVLDPRSPDEILGYDKDGLPR